MERDEVETFDRRIGMDRKATTTATRAPRMRMGHEVKPGESPWTVDPQQQAAAMQAIMGAAKLPRVGV
jgi:hypothetical protein